MNLVDIAVIFFGGYVVAIILAALVMTVRGGGGSGLVYVEEEAAEDRIILKQTAGIMPNRRWGFRPPVQHSHYDPAPWQVKPPRTDEHSLENVDRATDIKRELGSEHPPWERLDRQGL